MAEQFVIRVQVDGQQSRTQTTNSLGTALGASALLGGSTGRVIGPNSPLGNLKLAQSELLDQKEDLLEGQRIGFREKFGFDASKVDIIQQSDFVKQKQSFGTTKLQLGRVVRASGLNDVDFHADLAETYYRNVGGQALDLIKQNQTRILAGGAALGIRIVRAGISTRQHRSGNAYYNDRLNRDAKLAGYATALGFSAFKGPIGFGVVATGIAINETISFATERANFNFDRKMETQFIHNIEQVSGDISYGRRRRGGS
jgi:hypothetical protein